MDMQHLLLSQQHWEEEWAEEKGSEAVPKMHTAVLIAMPHHMNTDEIIM